MYGAGFVQVLWSPLSPWLKPICQFDPPVETVVYENSIYFLKNKARLNYVATMWPNHAEQMRHKNQKDDMITDILVEKMTNSQFSLFFEFLLEPFWQGELVDSVQFCGG